MKIQNNYQNNSVNFKANLRVLNSEGKLLSVYSDLSEIAKNLPKANGDTIVMSTKTCMNSDNGQNITSIKFDWFKNDNLYPNQTKSFSFEETDNGIRTDKNRLVDFEGYKKRIIEAFEEFVGTKS